MGTNLVFANNDYSTESPGGPPYAELELQCGECEGAGMTWVMVAFIAGGITAGDLLWAGWMCRGGAPDSLRPGRRYLAALCGYGLSFGVFLRLLAVSPVSVAVPAAATGYICQTLLSKRMLRQSITWRRWAGAVAITCAVVLLSL